jgi:dTMP kinase
MAVLGKFITFEGPEGGGKSTQVRRLAERLTAAGLTVITTREPGGTPTGEAIRGILQHDHAGEPICPAAELLLFEASRAQLVEHVIVPALKQGTWVICDRFIDSTAAYQGYGRGFDLAKVIEINTFAIGGCLPDLTILLDVEISAGQTRLALRNREQKTVQDRFEREHSAFHERVRAGYLELARRWPERIRTVDGMGDEARVADDVWRVISHAFMS